MVVFCIWSLPHWYIQLFCYNLLRPHRYNQYNYHWGVDNDHKSYIFTVLTNSNERFITLFLDILTIYMNISCLSPAESGLHWYWASAARVQRRSDNVSTGSLTMMTRRITDDGLTLWYEEVAGSGVWCGLSCTDDHCRAALQSGSYSQAGCQTGLDFPKFCSSNHPPPPNRCPEYGVQLPLSHARGFLRIFSE